jgi:ABC-type nitrate/sulfonate/bicarbonate transport system ATPase subunit
MPVEQKIGTRLSIKNISKTFYSKTEPSHIIDNVSFDVFNNEFLILLGPGHCGKTVLLNIISELESHEAGTVELDGKVLKEPDPKIGMVFQRIGLLPWKTVIENVEVGPKFKGENKNTRREKAKHYIKLVGLDGFENAFPYQLSGGMKQRVGIARAYTNDPEILLMDEPFGQLDAQTRYSMQNEIIRIWEKEKRTIVFVTNNLEEATYLGDRIILFSSCPAKVKEVYKINMPRPRDMMDPEFLKIRKIISENSDLVL